MKKTIYLFLVFIALITSCNQEEVITFESIEKEFAFKQPLTETSKRNIMIKYGSLEVYRKVLKNQYRKISENRDEFRNSIIKSRLNADITKEKQRYDSHRNLNVKSGDAGWCQGSVRVNLQMPGQFVSFGQYVFGWDTILEDAEDCGIKLPYSCRAGACGTCAAQLKQGDVNQDDQTFLDDEQIARGYVLLCVSHAITDCLIRTHTEHEL